jgi:hypothetical protein
LEIGDFAQITGIAFLKIVENLFFPWYGNVVLGAPQPLQKKGLIFPKLCSTLPFISQQDQQRGRILPLRGVNHVFRGLDAAVILLQNRF